MNVGAFQDERVGLRPLEASDLDALRDYRNQPELEGCRYLPWEAPEKVLLRFLFQELGLRVVRVWTHSGNPAAVGLAQKSGFRVSLRRREAVFKNGQLLDNLNLDLLRGEYFARHPELTDGLPVFD